MSRLTDLIREAKRLDSKLGEALDAEVRHLTERRAFGLNFERHAPEVVDLHGRPVRRGDKVRMLSPRGEMKAPDTRLWRATGATDTPDGRVIQLRDLHSDETAEYPVDDLVVVAESTDVIYPGLVSTGRIERGGDTPFHTVINSENLHALKALLYTHRGKIDCIYIDPPYNTGNDDWIYSDKYVAGDDLYRHSKWLSFMERRLVVAAELLSESGIIWVSIDDREQARLKLLLDQVLGANNHLGTFIWRTDGNLDNQAQVKINHEYIHAYAKNASLTYLAGVKDLNLDDSSKLFKKDIRNSVVKNGPKNPVSSIEIPPGFPAGFESGVIGARLDKYPNYDQDILVQDGRVVSGAVATTGWAGANLLRSFIRNGFEPIVDSKGQETRFEIDQNGTIENVKVRRSDQRHLLTVLMNMGTVETAGNDLKALGVNFPYPKPVPLIQYLVSTAPEDGVVLDFFCGSGTTVEAVIRENLAAATSRTCIAVTNNELSVATRDQLIAQGYRQESPEWLESGVFARVTRPRIEGLVSGVTPRGVKHPRPCPANVEFFDLTYEAPLKVSTHHDFERIAPLLWLRAGASGRRIDALPSGWDVAGTYGVIDRLQHTEQFVAALTENPDARVAFIVTDDERRFQTVVSQLPSGVEPVRLYESYLRNFEIDAARGAR